MGYKENAGAAPQRAMGYKGDAGRYSPKGIALNLFSMCVFVTPIILTTRGFQEWDWLWKVNVGMFLVMFATPPWGWKKPHPYRTSGTCGRGARSRGPGSAPPASVTHVVAFGGATKERRARDDIEPPSSLLVSSPRPEQQLPRARRRRVNRLVVVLIA